MSKKPLSAKAAKATAPAAVAAIPMDACGEAAVKLDRELALRCRAKTRKLKPCKEQNQAGCGCGGPTGGHEGRCQHVARPDLRPCISVSWGDSDCDCMETDDLERFCITICNCYDNVTFEGVMLAGVTVRNLDGSMPATLPDGTASVEVIPLGPICFGDIAPCRPGQVSCVSREFAISTRGAKHGDYKLELGPLCFKTTFRYSEHACFELRLCADRRKGI